MLSVLYNVIFSDFATTVLMNIQPHVLFIY